MLEELKEEAAQVTGEPIVEQEDISKKYTPTQQAKMRQSYVRNRKDEIEILDLDVRFQDLQIRHFENSKKFTQINDEISKIRKEMLNQKTLLTS